MDQVHPAKMLLTCMEDESTRHTKAVGAFLFTGFGHVEQAGKHQKADLLDHGQWVGDASGPEALPEFVDVVTQCAGKHWG